MTEKEIYQLYKIYMSADEYVLWEGKPEKGHLLTPEDAFIIPFSVIWSAGAFSVLAISVAELALPFFAIALFFSVIGAYISVGRFIHKSYIRKHTNYLITNRKVFCCYKNKVKIRTRQSITEIHLKTYKDGCGNIVFEDFTPFTKKDTGLLDLGSERVSLMNIKDVHSVYKILVEKPD